MRSIREIEFPVRLEGASSWMLVKKSTELGVYPSSDSPAVNNRENMNTPSLTFHFVRPDLFSCFYAPGVYTSLIV